MLRGHVHEQERARVHDHPRRRPVGLDPDRTGEHALISETPTQGGDVVEPVEQRQNQPWRGLDSLQRRLHALGLGGDYQRLDRLLERRDGVRAGDELAEADAAHAQPVRGDGRRRGISGHDHDPLAGALERAGEQPTHASGTEYRDRHRSGSISAPGFMMPAGSTAALAARSARAKGSGRWRSYHGRWSRPTAWWWVIVPPWRRSASLAACLISPHCSSSLPRRPGAITV